MKDWLKKKALWLLGIKPITKITIEQSALEDLCQMAIDAHPNEMLAFLSSSKGNKNGHIHVDEIQLQAYTAGHASAQVNLHQLPPYTNIVGTIHSHPGGSRRPSSADKNLWGSFGFLHAIIGEPYTIKHITFFNKEAEILDIPITQTGQISLKKADFRKV